MCRLKRSKQAAVRSPDHALASLTPPRSPDEVELLLLSVLLPADGEAVDPGDVPGQVVAQVVGEEHDLTQEDVGQVGLLVAPFDVDLVFDDVPDHVLLLLADLLFGAPVFALLLGPVEEALLPGDFGGLDPVLGHRHQVVDGLPVAAVPAVILDTRRGQRGTEGWTSPQSERSRF